MWPLLVVWPHHVQLVSKNECSKGRKWNLARFGLHSDWHMVTSSVLYGQSDSQESSPIPQFTCINSSVLRFLCSPTRTSIHDYRKNHSFDGFPSMSLLFSMLSGFVIAFLPRSKHLLISWLQSPSAVIFGIQENKVCHCFHYLPMYLPWSNGTRYHDLHFLNVEF